MEVMEVMEVEEMDMYMQRYHKIQTYNTNRIGWNTHPVECERDAVIISVY